MSRDNKGDLSGQQYGKLLVIKDSGKRTKSRGILYECLCECGNYKLIRSSDLRDNRRISCGCVWKENLKERHTTHGLSKTNDYKSYHAMKDRCYNPNHTEYRNYGGKGVRVCDRWLESYENFLEDMGVRPTGMFLDRKDSDGNYEPSNCRWASRQQNNQNTSKRKNCSSKYKGVSFHKKTGKWRAYIEKNGKYLHLGLFETEEMAAMRYNKEALLVFKEFAKLNTFESEEIKMVDRKSESIANVEILGL